MAKRISKVKEIDVATVEGNKTLATASDRRAVERCKEAIEKIGVVHTPVVGATKDGNRLLLSGQSELIALRELGVKKMDAIEVDVTGGGGARAKLSLLLISLQDKPGALCEGLLLQEAVSDGVARAEIQTMLGRSASWVSNRLSLVTRLDGGVYEMVKGGLLDPRSAQEVARLPAESQFAFAEIAVREGLPKSVIESLVCGYNDESCPDAVKAQILSDPRAALKRMADKRRAVNVGKTGVKAAQKVDIETHIDALNLQMALLCSMLYKKPPDEINAARNSLKNLENELSIMLVVIRKLVSPGKTEVAQNAG